MSESGDPGRRLSAQELFPGRLIEVRDREGFSFRAQVEECAPHLQVVWVRESGPGQRRLVPVSQCRHRVSGSRVTPCG